MTAEPLRKVAWLAALGLCLLAGCGGQPDRGGVAVGGAVTLDGAPLPSGSVVFVPAAGAKGHKAAAEVTDGKFQLDAALGPVPGQYRVEVYGEEPSDVPLDDPVAYAESAPRLPPPNPVAAEYNRQSVLTATIDADGPNEFFFQVESRK